MGVSERPPPCRSAASRGELAVSDPARPRPPHRRIDGEPRSAAREATAALGKPADLVARGCKSAAGAEDRRREISTACARSRTLSAGSTRRASAASSRSSWRRPAPARCRRRSAASRSRSSPGAPATCRSAIAREATAISFGGGLEKDQIPLDAALEALKPLLEDPAVLKIGQNIKDDWLVLARHGIEMAPIDDTMLMSYALDAGAMKHGHGLGELAGDLLGHERIELQGGRRHRQGQGDLRPRADRQGDRLRGGGLRPGASALGRPEGAASGRARHARLRAAGAADDPGARDDGAARHQGRPADPVAPLRQFRAEGGGGRSGDLRARRPGIQHRLDQAARRHPLRQDGARRRQEDQDRAMVDRREGAGRAWPRKACRSRGRSSTGGS